LRAGRVFHVYYSVTHAVMFRRHVLAATFVLPHASNETRKSGELAKEYRLTCAKRAAADSKLYFFGAVGPYLFQRFKESFVFGFILNLSLPGMGHAYLRDYMFGVFIFLVMVIASIVFFFSFLVEIPLVVTAVLLGVPAVFYIFTFVDLRRSMKTKPGRAPRRGNTARLFLVIAFAGGLFLPLAPVNFLLRNLPAVYQVDDDNSEPVSAKGDIFFVNRAAYRANLFFLEQPYAFDVPERWDVVAFVDSGSNKQLGWVIGNGGETVSIENDSLFIDGSAVSGDPESMELRGHLPLTPVAAGAILIATLEKGAVVGAEQVSLRDVIGKARRLF